MNSSNEKKYEFLATTLSPKLKPELAPILNQILKGTKDLDVTRSLIAFANAELINVLEMDLLQDLFRDFSAKNDEKCFQIQASIVNKLNNPDSVLSIHQSSHECPRQVLWIAKGLFFRKKMYLSSKTWLEKLLRMLEQNIEIEFDILIGPLEPFLDCLESHAALVRQKIFSLSKPALVKGFQDGTNPSGHLRALICQLPFVPKFALYGEISSILPLLMNGLQASEEKLCYESLSCLKDILEHEPGQFSSFLSSIIPSWIKIANKQQMSMKTRIKSLECIKAAAKCDDKDRVPLKKDVLKGLIPALDDRKRLVRQAAGAARNAWSIL